MRPKRILLDLDGVLNKSPMSFLRHVGCPVDPDRYDAYPIECGWDLVGAANLLHPSRRFTVKTFWDAIDRSAWAIAPISDEFHWLLHRCEQTVGRENICILTSPTICPECHAGKCEWIQRFCPKWLRRQYLIGPRKNFCAHPDGLLIDDADHNVTSFREHGSQALLVPRPWNSLHAVDTLSHLEAEFSKLA